MGAFILIAMIAATNGAIRTSPTAVRSAMQVVIARQVQFRGSALWAIIALKVPALSRAAGFAARAT